MPVAQKLALEKSGGLHVGDSNHGFSPIILVLLLTAELAIASEVSLNPGRDEGRLPFGN